MEVLGPGEFEVEIETDQRLWCWNGSAYLEGEGWTWPVQRLLGVDAETGAVLPQTGDNLGAGYDANWHYEMIGEKRLRVRGPREARAEVGCRILFWCTSHDTGTRFAPGIFIAGAENVVCEAVTLHARGRWV